MGGYLVRAIRGYDADGNETWRESTEQEDANNAALIGKARAAIQANSDFLANQSPTQAQVLTQVRMLTRENTALIRLALGLTDSLEGT